MSVTGRFRSGRGPGKVWLVGAGPGDPELLTVRAERLLVHARVIAHDELVPPAVLALASREAEVFSVGRRAQGVRHHDERIDPRIVGHALAGRDVLRLKAGDPFVFGRGGEEAEALSEMDIPFEVVPGITAALGAAASAGIPLTHRDVSASLTFVTAHSTRGEAGPRFPNHVPAQGTLVLYMGLATLDATMLALVEGGRSEQTPVAIVTSATRPDQRLLTGTVSTIAGKAAAAGLDAPALVVVGEVVRRRIWSSTGAEPSWSEAPGCHSDPW